MSRHFRNIVAALRMGAVAIRLQLSHALKKQYACLLDLLKILHVGSSLLRSSIFCRGYVDDSKPHSKGKSAHLSDLSSLCQELYVRARSSSLEDPRLPSGVCAIPLCSKALLSCPQNLLARSTFACDQLCISRSTSIFSGDDGFGSFGSAPAPVSKPAPAAQTHPAAAPLSSQNKASTSQPSSKLWADTLSTGIVDLNLKPSKWPWITSSRFGC